MSRLKSQSQSAAGKPVVPLILTRPTVPMTKDRSRSAAETVKSTDEVSRMMRSFRSHHRPHPPIESVTSHNTLKHTLLKRELPAIPQPLNIVLIDSSHGGGSSDTAETATDTDVATSSKSPKHTAELHPLLYHLTIDSFSYSKPVECLVRAMLKNLRDGSSSEDSLKRVTSYESYCERTCRRLAALQKYFGQVSSAQALLSPDSVDDRSHQRENSLDFRMLITDIAQAQKTTLISEDVDEVKVRETGTTMTTESGVPLPKESSSTVFHCIGDSTKLASEKTMRVKDCLMSSDGSHSSCLMIILHDYCDMVPSSLSDNSDGKNNAGMLRMMTADGSSNEMSDRDLVGDLTLTEPQMSLLMSASSVEMFHRFSSISRRRSTAVRNSVDDYAGATLSDEESDADLNSSLSQRKSSFRLSISSPKAVLNGSDRKDWISSGTSATKSPTLGRMASLKGFLSSSKSSKSQREEDASSVHDIPKIGPASSLPSKSEGISKRKRHSKIASMTAIPGMKSLFGSDGGSSKKESHPHPSSSSDTSGRGSVIRTESQRKRKTDKLSAKLEKFGLGFGTSAESKSSRATTESVKVDSPVMHVSDDAMLGAAMDSSAVGQTGSSRMTRKMGADSSGLARHSYSVDSPGSAKWTPKAMIQTLSWKRSSVDAWSTRDEMTMVDDLGTQIVTDHLTVMKLLLFELTESASRWIGGSMERQQLILHLAGLCSDASLVDECAVLFEVCLAVVPSSMVDSVSLCGRFESRMGKLPSTLELSRILQAAAVARESATVRRRKSIDEYLSKELRLSRKMVREVWAVYSDMPHSELPISNLGLSLTMDAHNDSSDDDSKSDGDDHSDDDQLLSFREQTSTMLRRTDLTFSEIRLKEHNKRVKPCVSMIEYWALMNDDLTAHGFSVNALSEDAQESSKQTALLLGADSSSSSASSSDADQKNNEDDIEDCALMLRPLQRYLSRVSTLERERRIDEGLGRTTKSRDHTSSVASSISVCDSSQSRDVVLSDDGEQCDESEISDDDDEYLPELSDTDLSSHASGAIQTTKDGKKKKKKRNKRKRKSSSMDVLIGDDNVVDQGSMTLPESFLRRKKNQVSHAKRGDREEDSPSDSESSVSLTSASLTTSSSVLGGRPSRISAALMVPHSSGSIITSDPRRRSIRSRTKSPVPPPRRTPPPPNITVVGKPSSSMKSGGISTKTALTKKRKKPARKESASAKKASIKRRSKKAMGESSKEIAKVTKTKSAKGTKTRVKKRGPSIADVSALAVSKSGSSFAEAARLDSIDTREMMDDDDCEPSSQMSSQLVISRQSKKKSKKKVIRRRHGVSMETPPSDDPRFTDEMSALPSSVPTRSILLMGDSSASLLGSPESSEEVFSLSIQSGKKPKSKSKSKKALSKSDGIKKKKRKKRSENSSDQTIKKSLEDMKYEMLRLECGESLVQGLLQVCCSLSSFHSPSSSSRISHEMDISEEEKVKPRAMIKEEWKLCYCYLTGASNVLYFFNGDLLSIEDPKSKQSWIFKPLLLLNSDDLSLSYSRSSLSFKLKSNKTGMIDEQYWKFQTTKESEFKSWVSVLRKCVG